MFERHILSSSKPPRMAKETSSFVKSRAKGTVNYPPYEALDDASLGEIQHYQIQPFGRIQEFCRHIPYNSGKKNFFDKTGRESFEGEQAEQKDAAHPKMGVSAPPLSPNTPPAPSMLTFLMQCSNTPSKSPVTRASIPSCGITTLVSCA